jgi:ATP-dependent helicase/nuclease subunit A
VNFRSARPIVDWVNGTFGATFPPHPDAFTGAVPYTPSTAFREGSADAGVTVHPIIGRDDRAEANLVIDLLERGTPTAILVRSRAHLAAIAAHLRDEGVRYRAIEIQALAERPLVQDLLALTRALLHLGDRAAWLSVLRAPWCGLTLADLHTIASPDLKAAIWEEVRRPDLLLTPDGAPRLARVVPILSQALSQRGRVPVAQLVERTWFALGGPAIAGEYERSDARAFLELLETPGQDGDIADFRLLAQRVNDLFANPDSGPDCSLELMTIHNAKGLEFDTVILPGLGKRARSDDPELLLWSERAVEGSAELLMAPISRTGSDEDRIYRFIRHEEAAKTEHESVRLLYVACTRAERRLHLIGHVELEPGEPPQDSLLAHVWDQVRPEFEECLRNYVCDAVPDHKPRTPRVLRRVKLTGPVAPLAEPSAAPAARVALDTSERDTARAVGTLIHRVFQRIAEDGLDAWSLERITALETVIDEAAWPLVEASVGRTLSDERGRWILSAHGEAQSEFAVTGLLDGELKNFVIDRTFVDEAGTRWIIDFKTADDEPDYRRQLEAYARVLAAMDSRPIRLGLYFAVTGDWFDWAIEQP